MLDTTIALRPLHAGPRPRRLRRTPALAPHGARDPAAPRTTSSTRSSSPPGRASSEPIASMPGHAQRSVDRLAAEMDELAALGIPAVLLFGHAREEGCDRQRGLGRPRPVPAGHRARSSAAARTWS